MAAEPIKFRIADLHTPELREAAQKYDQDGNGWLEAERDRVVAQIEADLTVKALPNTDPRKFAVAQILQAMRDPTWMPRTKQAHDEIEAVEEDMKRLMELAGDKKKRVLSTASIHDRKTMINSIISQSLYVTDARQVRIMEILNACPPHQRYALAELLDQVGMLDQMYGAMKGAEDSQLRDYMNRHYYNRTDFSFDERLARIQSLLDRDVVTNDRERQILNIINGTPEPEKEKLAAKLYELGYIGRIRYKFDGQEFAEVSRFLLNQLYKLPKPEDVARATDQLAFWSWEPVAEMLAKVRATRGDAFAEQVVAQMYAQGDFNHLMPWLYTPPAGRSTQGAIVDAAGNELNRQGHKVVFNRMMTVLPDGRTKGLLKADFARMQNLQRAADAIGVGVGILNDVMSTQPR